MARPSKSQDRVRPAPRLRRAYYDCRYGQLHLHNAIPGGGGFDELTPVICLHGTGETGRVFMPLLAALGEDRSVYALDLPGAGESDPAPGEPPSTRRCMRWWISSTRCAFVFSTCWCTVPRRPRR